MANAEQQIRAELAVLTTTVETLRQQVATSVIPVINELQTQKAKMEETEKKLETTESLLTQTVDELNSRVRPIKAF